jgi:hypothetical protein
MTPDQLARSEQRTWASTRAIRMGEHGRVDIGFKAAWDDRIHTLRLDTPLEDVHAMNSG